MSKDYLANNLKKDLSLINNFDIKIIEDFLKNYFESYDYSKDHNIKYIDIFSPFFDLLLKTNIFEKEFIIPIIPLLIEKNRLKND